MDERLSGIEEGGRERARAQRVADAPNHSPTLGFAAPIVGSDTIPIARFFRPFVQISTRDHHCRIDRNAATCAGKSDSKVERFREANSPDPVPTIMRCTLDLFMERDDNSIADFVRGCTPLHLQERRLHVPDTIEKAISENCFTSSGPKIRDTNINDIPHPYSGSFVLGCIEASF